MKKYLTFLLMLTVAMTMTACANDEPMKIGKTGNTAYFGGKKTLIAYFSWGGTTQRMAQQIQDITGADMFRIEPLVPYPTEYTPCTEVAREENDNNARPAIKGTVDNWDDYDVVFIGCPVWWWTTPMIIHTFCESYDFKGKTVVPFCTYAATYRDETLAEIVNSTPDAQHLAGEGLTSGRINPSTIRTWIDLINEEMNANNGINSIVSDTDFNGATKMYDLNGRIVNPDTAERGIYIVMDANGSRKILK
ncbi:MAG: flavodoxin [Bacteroidales bacterium]|nr:flavodoxin [Bacteroidales bacterium]